MPIIAMQEVPSLYLAIVIVVSTYIINKADRTVVKDRLPKPAKTVNPIATDEEMGRL